MERSIMSEPATRIVSTVATDHVGVSASDRISPSPPAILDSIQQAQNQRLPKEPGARSSSP